MRACTLLVCACLREGHQRRLASCTTSPIITSGTRGVESNTMCHGVWNGTHDVFADILTCACRVHATGGGSVQRKAPKRVASSLAGTAMWYGRTRRANTPHGGMTHRIAGPCVCACVRACVYAVSSCVMVQTLSLSHTHTHSLSLSLLSRPHAFFACARVRSYVEVSGPMKIKVPKVRRNAIITALPTIRRAAECMSHGSLTPLP